MAKKAAVVLPKTADDMIRFVNETMGPGVLVKASDTHWVRPIERLASGSLSLDVALGGGYPRGRMTQIYGRESSAKSALALLAIARAQRDGETCLIINIENDFDPQWAVSHGVDLERVHVSHPESLNHAADILELATRTDDYAVIVFDSVAAGTSMHEQERSSTQAERGGVATVVNKMLRKTNTALASKPKNRPNRTCIILVNQMRTSMDSYVPVDYAPGGTQLKYLPVVHVKVGWARGDEVKEEDDVLSKLSEKKREGQEGTVNVARQVQFIVEKNKTARPMLRGQFDFYYQPVDGCPVGVDRSEEILRLGVASGIISKGGAWIEIPISGGKKHRVQGQDAALRWLRANVDVQDALQPDILASMLRSKEPPAAMVVKPSTETEESDVPEAEPEPAARSGPKPQDTLHVLIQAGKVEKRGPAWVLIVETGEVVRPAEAAARCAELMGGSNGVKDDGGSSGEAAEPSPARATSKSKGRRKKGR